MTAKQELSDFLAEVRSNMLEMAEANEGNYTDEQQARWDALDTWESDAKAQLAAIETREARLAEIQTAYAQGRTAVIPGDTRASGMEGFNANTRSLTYDLETPGKYGRDHDMEVRDRALYAVEKGDGWVKDSHREAATQKLEQLGNKNHAAEIVLAGADPLYRAAFSKYASQQEGRVANMDRDEEFAMHRAQAALQSSGFYTPVNDADEVARSLVVSNVTGVLVPSQLDPSIVLTNAGTINPIRRISREVSVATNVWTGVSSAGVTAEWNGTEGTAVTDGTPSFSSPAVTCYMYDAFAAASFQAFEDWQGGSAELEMMFNDAVERLTATAFATGSGSSQPYGIVTAITGVASHNLFMATNNAFAVTDPYIALEGLPARWRNGAQWVMNLNYIDRIRQFGTSNVYHGYTVDYTAGSPGSLLGKPLNECSDFTGTLSTGTNNAIIYGNFDNYLIANRVGTSTEFVQLLHSVTTGMPRPIRGWLMHGRVGADSINDNAFVLLTNQNTATTTTGF